MKRKYDTSLYRDPTKLIIVFSLFTIVAITVIIFLAKQYEFQQLGFVLAIIVFASPIIIGRMIKRKFLEKKVVLDFDDTTFLVTIFTLDGNTMLSQESYLWSEIEAYRFYFDTKTNTCLTLYLTGKRRKTFIFRDNKTFEDAKKENSVFSNFYFFVNQHSRTGHKIKVRPSLLATKTGQIIISSEIAIIIFAFILHLITHNFSKSYYLIFAIVLLIPQIINRSQNKAVYKKMLELG